MASSKSWPSRNRTSVHGAAAEVCCLFWANLQCTWNNKCNDSHVPGALKISPEQIFAVLFQTIQQNQADTGTAWQRTARSKERQAGGSRQCGRYVRV